MFGAIKSNKINKKENYNMMKTVYASFPGVQSIHENHLIKIAQQKRGYFHHDLILRIQKLSYPSQKHNESLWAFSLTQSEAYWNMKMFCNQELVSN